MNNENVQFAITLAVKSLLKSFYKRECEWNVRCAVFAEVKDYQRDVLSPVTAQISSQASVVASILEQHTAEISAAQEWDNEWNNQGLLSRFTPQANIHTVLFES